jgi:hypothetical protein
MGCWDIYCFVCGNPCHGMFDDSIEYLQDNIKEHENAKRSNKKLRQTQKQFDAYKKNPNLIRDLKKFQKTTT